MEIKQVLIITDVNFWEGGAGHRARISSLVSFLSSNTALTILYVGQAKVLSENAFLERYSCRVIASNNLRKVPTDQYAMQVGTLLTGLKFDAVIVEYIHNTYFLQFVNDEAEFILDCHDVVSERSKEFKRFEYPNRYYDLVEEEEFKLFKLYDYVIAICLPDFNKIEKIISKEKTLLCPHAVVTFPGFIREDVKNITFIGSEYLPNVDAINSFVINCWPEIYKKHDVKLNIVGNVCKELSIKSDKINLLGFVADLTGVYQHADIIINPVRFGAGLKIKNVEALSKGKPLVTTKHGARGMYEGEGTAFLVGSTNEEFTSQLLNLIDDYSLRKWLSLNAITYTNENFSAEKCFSPLMQVIQVVV
ncbi:glycosyltransferase [Mucilaginibacter sp.]|uniref:glycosyltransferase n=1 Tax=Mucilaginibacter sp. TaxID=1882438 RepID=UPI002842918E|nr:glycosyltransferase [Mucilaginibacter sp.]MDR3694227.1 glycosyltransferase [Mucilaginibacter sp.]